MDDKDKRIAELEQQLKELRFLFNALRDEFYHFIDALRNR